MTVPSVRDHGRTVGPPDGTPDEPAGRCSSAPPPAVRSREGAAGTTIFLSWCAPDNRTKVPSGRRTGAAGTDDRPTAPDSTAVATPARSPQLHRMNQVWPHPVLRLVSLEQYRSELLTAPDTGAQQPDRMDRVREGVHRMASRRHRGPGAGSPGTRTSEDARRPAAQSGPRRLPARGLPLEGRGRVPRRHACRSSSTAWPRGPARHGGRHPAAHRPAARRPRPDAAAAGAVRGHGRDRPQPGPHHPRLARASSRSTAPVAARCAASVSRSGPAAGPPRSPSARCTRRCSTSPSSRTSPCGCCARTTSRRWRPTWSPRRTAATRSWSTSRTTAAARCTAARTTSRPSSASDLPQVAAPGRAGRAFASADLVAVREDVLDHALQRRGAGRSARADLALAVHEVAANSIEHGPRPGPLRIWREDEALVCEIRDVRPHQRPAGRADAAGVGRRGRPRALDGQPAVRPGAGAVRRRRHYRPRSTPGSSRLGPRTHGPHPATVHPRRSPPDGPRESRIRW